MNKTIPTLCGSVAGNPSPLGVKLHNAGYVAAGLSFTYLAIGTTDLSSVVETVRRLPLRGLGVSMPFKQAVIPLLDEVGEDVRAIGACNTIVNDGGVLRGYNTDWLGATHAIKEAGIEEVSHALVVGAGGVARAIAYGLREMGATVTIAARNRQAAQTIVEDLGLAGATDLESQSMVDADLLVNATPVAVADGPLCLGYHRQAKAVFDVVFQQRQTELIKAAAARSLRVVPGWRMLLYQALEQFRLYTGQEAPLSAMSDVLEEALPG